MSEILCFGDSNTWGFNPSTRGRYPRHIRWTGVLARELGPGHHVIEEGLNGRTTVFDDPIETHRRGRDYLIPCLRSHAPLDLVIIMLGTNDVKLRFSAPAYDIAKGMSALVGIIKQAAPQVLLMSPPPLAKLTEFAEQFEGGTEKSKRLAGYYSGVAAEFACHFLDAGEFIISSDVDGLHFDAPEHAKLGMAVAAKVRSLGLRSQG